MESLRNKLQQPCTVANLTIQAQFWMLTGQHPDISISHLQIWHEDVLRGQLEDDLGGE
jgi:hypothetical protein